jgi:ribonuclease HII
MITIGGIDEVGRGSLAGPIMAAVAVFDRSLTECPLEGVKDSKLFSTEEGRETVFHQLMQQDWLLDFGVGSVSCTEIDQMGINPANREVFRRAMWDLRPQYLPNYLIIDGLLDVPDYKGQKLLVPKADLNYWQVSAASIIAKVLRDRLMGELHLAWPVYHWISNKGYGSATHREALRIHGSCAHHRMKFVKRILSRDARPAHPGL